MHPIYHRQLAPLVCIVQEQAAATTPLRLACVESPEELLPSPPTQQSKETPLRTTFRDARCRYMCTYLFPKTAVLRVEGRGDYRCST